MLDNNIYYIKAQDFIRDNDLNSLPNGTHVIDEGNLWVNIIEGELRSEKDALMEVHDRFIDIHIPLSCPEGYGVRERSLCTSPRGEFEGDNLLFNDSIARVFVGQVGEQTVFEPDMAHAPMIGTGHIRKAIFKVRVM